VLWTTLTLKLRLPCNEILVTIGGVSGAYCLWPFAKAPRSGKTSSRPLAFVSVPFFPPHHHHALSFFMGGATCNVGR